MHLLLRARASLPGGVAAFVVFVCLAIVGFSAYTTWHAHDVAIRTARREVQNLAASLAQQAADSLEVADVALDALVEQTNSARPGSGEPAQLADAMHKAVSASPRLNSLAIVDARGKMILDSTSASVRTDVDEGDLEFFRYHRSHANLGSYVSGPLRSRTQSEWVIDVTRRINRPNGAFAGVAVAQIALDYFEATYAAVDVGPSGIITLVRDNGIVMVRKPLVESFIGRQTGNPAVFTDPLRWQSAGTNLYNSRLDGVRRLSAFRRLDHYPLVILVGVAESDYLAQWRADAWMNRVVTLSIVLLIALLGGILIAQIDERKKAEGALARLAWIDGLTGIANRRQFDDALEREWSVTLRRSTALALLMIDVDHFKDYNDRYGHQGGDEVLRTIAATITGSVRPSELGARYGGEEFAVIAPGIDLAGAFKLAERIRAAIAALALPHAGSRDGIVTVSIGVASVSPPSQLDARTLLASADRALYEAKHSGRNRTAPAEVSAGGERTAGRVARGTNNLVRELDRDPGVGEAEILPRVVGQIP